MRDAICSNSLTGSVCCPQRGTLKHQKRHQTIAITLCAFLPRFDEFLFINLSLSLFDRHDPVDANIRHLIDRAAGPTYLNQIHFRAFLESEVQPQITLRQVTITTADLVDLRLQIP